ncbi:MAG: ATP-binding protein [Gemmatimonadaceae bacterium]
MSNSSAMRREWSVRSDISKIEPLVAEVVNLCLSAGMSSRACRLNISVALTEALSNAIICGNHSDAAKIVMASMSLDATSLTLEVTDEGQGFDASEITCSPDDADWLEREDGRGLFLMRSLMDKVEIQKPSQQHGGLTVRMVLHRS